jgi:hypothetical protein
VHHHLDGVHPLVGHDVVGDLPGHRLDQVARRTRHDVGGTLRQPAVVESVGQIVTCRRGREVGPDGDVDDEVLAVAALMGENSMVSPNGQPAQFDSISHC